MADRTHLTLLRQGVEAWNQWRTDNRETQPDLGRADLGGLNLAGANLSEANLMGASFRQANLTGASFRQANLIGANLRETTLAHGDLRGTTLTQADLRDAQLRGTTLTHADLTHADLGRTDFTHADLGGANLTEANLMNAHFSGANLMKTNLTQASFIGANLIRANLIGSNPIGANFSGAYLSGANLSGANLSEANFGGANLIGANLRKIQALNTNFCEAIFTGACIEEWYICASVQLEGVKCEYVYLRSYYDSGKLQFGDRRPHDFHRNFAPGEFVALVQQVVETMDLVFRNGIEWEVFFKAFNALQKKVKFETGGIPICIQAIERKLDGSFAIRINVPPDTDKAKLKQRFQQQYHRTLQAFKPRKQIQMEAPELLRFPSGQRSTDWMEIAKRLSNHSEQ